MQQYFSLTGLLGLALAYALSTTTLLGALLGTFTETEKELVSVERVHAYVDGWEREEQHTGDLQVAVSRALRGNACLEKNLQTERIYKTL